MLSISYISALMDQKACKEEPGLLLQNKTDIEEEDRDLTDEDGGKRGGERDGGGMGQRDGREGYGGQGFLSVASWRQWK